MASLQLANKAKALALSNRPARLYKTILREIPRVLLIYDIAHFSEESIRKKMRQHFHKQADVKDERVIDMLLTKGYTELEDTLLQHKQKNHLMLLLEGYTGTDYNDKRIKLDSNDEEAVDEQFWR